MSVRRMMSYRLFLLRSALGRLRRALAYYWVSVRAELRTWRSAYVLQLLGYRARRATSATGRAVVRAPRRLGSALGLVAWFFGQLPPYVARVLADRREDRAELRAERRLIAAQRREAVAQRRAQRRSLLAAGGALIAQRRGALSEHRAASAERRARRRAELAQIKAGRAERPHALPVPAWISQLERPQRAAGARAIPVPRRAVVAAVLALAATVPAYAVVSHSLSDGRPALAADPNAVAGPSVPGAATVPGAPTVAGAPTVPGVPGPSPVATAGSAGTAAAGPAAVPAPVGTGSTRDFVATLPPVPTAVPVIPGARTTAVAPGPGTAPAPTPEQKREARRLAHYQRQATKEAAKYNRDPGK